MKVHEIHNVAELIKALRWCQKRGCSKCVALLDNGSCKYGGAIKIFDAAADALEAADIKIADYTAAIDALDDSNDAYIKENERLKNAPTIDAVPVVHGEWISEWGGCLGYTLTVKCSICGAEALYRYDGDDTDVDRVYSRYCPNCGAKMKGENDGET